MDPSQETSRLQRLEYHAQQTEKFYLVMHGMKLLHGMIYSKNAAALAEPLGR
jgi:hypothetical protein